VENLAAYVFTVARNEAFRYAGRQARLSQRQKPLAAADLFLDAKSEDQTAREMADLVNTALGALSLEQREVVELKIYGGLTFREIAVVTGVPLPTAATRYRAALEHLRGWLARQLS
jgi:RNA polymerase sigma-70 factor, ECF subfamily